MKFKYTYLLIATPFLVLMYRSFVPEPNENFTKATSKARMQRPAPIQYSPETLAELELEAENIKASLSEDTNSESPAIKINSRNFEGLIQYCLEGKPCDFIEDPWIVYLTLKSLNRQKSTQTLIEYLSAQKLTDPEFREKYRIIVKDMIDDFVAKEDRPIFEANYYMHVGEHEKALKMFEKFNNPIYDLNLANIHYDLKHYDKAYKYYQEARERLILDEKDPNKIPALDYVEERINQTKKQLNN